MTDSATQGKMSGRGRFQRERGRLEWTAEIEFGEWGRSGEVGPNHGDDCGRDRVRFCGDS